MIYCFVRLILIAITILCYVLFRKKKQQKVFQWKALLIGVPIFAVLFLIPFENLFITFPTKESAIFYSAASAYGEVLEGEESAFTVGAGINYDGSLYLQPMAALKTEKGYKILPNQYVYLVGTIYTKQCPFSVYRVLGTDDYYFTTPGGELEFEISDEYGGNSIVSAPDIGSFITTYIYHVNYQGSIKDYEFYVDGERAKFRSVFSFFDFNF